MVYGSSPRDGAKVRLVVLHTAEGARTKESLAGYFNNNSGASAHAGIDATGILDMVGRDRAAWTLGAGNPISVNAELCGFARWTRDQWLSSGTADGCVNPRQMIRNAAAWVKRECQALGIPVKVLTIGEVGSGDAGVCDHNAYNKAYRAGDHWDVGAGFPWDVFAQDLGGNQEDEVSWTTPIKLDAGERDDGKGSVTFNADVWLKYANYYAAGAREAARAAQAEAKAVKEELAAVKAKLENISAGNVDYDLLAAKVADQLSARLSE